MDDAMGVGAAVMPRPSDLTDMDAHLAQVQQRTWGLAQQFTEPTEDFSPIMELVTETKVFVVEFPPQLLGSEEGKNYLVDQLMVPLIHKIGAQFLSLVTSAWSVKLEKGQAEREGGVRPASEYENRTENCLITELSRLRGVMSSAPIWRTDFAPPTLGPWETLFDTGESDAPVMDGRFYTPLMEALRDS